LIALIPLLQCWGRENINTTAVQAAIDARTAAVAEHSSFPQNLHQQYGREE
jgi:hypothetical protein